MIESILDIANQIRKRLDDIDSDLHLNLAYYEPMLQGYCGIASRMLYDLTDNKTRLIMGKFDRESIHCWNTYNNLIIDITATQFHINKKVYITNINDEDYVPVYANATAIQLMKRWHHNIDWFNYSINNNIVSIEPTKFYHLNHKSLWGKL